MITEASSVGLAPNGRDIYRVDNVVLVPVSQSAVNYLQPVMRKGTQSHSAPPLQSISLADEKRYQEMIDSVVRSGSLFFAPEFDLTLTQQARRAAIAACVICCYAENCRVELRRAQGAGGPLASRRPALLLEPPPRGRLHQRSQVSLSVRCCLLPSHSARGKAWTNGCPWSPARSSKSKTTAKSAAMMSVPLSDLMLSVNVTVSQFRLMLISRRGCERQGTRQAVHCVTPRP